MGRVYNYRTSGVRFVRWPCASKAFVGPGRRPLPVSRSDFSCLLASDGKPDDVGDRPELSVALGYDAGLLVFSSVLSNAARRCCRLLSQDVELVAKNLHRSRNAASAVRTRRTRTSCEATDRTSAAAAARLVSIADVAVAQIKPQATGWAVLFVGSQRQSPNRVNVQSAHPSCLMCNAFLDQIMHKDAPKTYQ